VYDRLVDARTNVLGADAPAFTTADAESMAHALYGLRASAAPLVSERDQNFRLTDADGGAWVLKIANAVEDPAVVDMEVAAVRHLAALDPSLPVPAPRPSDSGELVVPVPGRPSGTHLVRLIPFLPGRHAEPSSLSAAALAEVGRVTARVGRALRGFFHPAAGRVILWDLKHLDDLRVHLAAIPDSERRAMVERALHRYDRIVAPALPGLRAQVIHNDLTLDNLLLDGDRVAGILDFGDMAHTALVLDVPATLQSVLRGRRDLFEAAGQALGGYVEVTPLEADEGELLADLLAARMVQTVLISVWRTAAYPDNAYITGWLEPAYELLAELEATGWDESTRRLAAAARGPAPATRIPSAELAERRRVLGTALSPLTYARPLHLVRGEGVWLWDADGRRYLDAYNNVPVVGHAHPRVVEAITTQARTLNTNTRYLHESVVLLAERLTASMPAGIDTVMFVNSGSEANDLAWRLATVATGGSGGIVSGWSYHGLTAAIADLSSSEWPRGEQPPSVETIPAPNPYRGPHASAADPDAAFAAELTGAVERLAERGHRAAAMFIDGTFTADGIVPPSDRYLQDLAERARAAGVVYVADEVQSGHGRTGAGLWSFGPSGITPDVVTLGKPMGNGHPVAAVAARSEIVDQFGADHEFFSTFGGNPVACAAALTVLDVIEDEGLVANAARVGDRLRAAIGALADAHSAIGDVRGRGLMIGVDLVVDRVSRTPDRELARRVMNGMRDRGVLISTTGRDGNVLKIRPPLVITDEQATLIVTTLDEALTAASR
jgi:4-aminobutyrate aminotransferase-like enzyme/Ser/Thr protein kinase RdoA (MazF antagonist)